MAERNTAANAAKKSYNFGEKTQEFADGHNVDVWQSPKYIESKAAAISLLESKDFGGVLCEGDFWILMNKTKSGKMAYTGLIIGHDALLKINNVLPEDRRFKEEYCGNPEPFEYAGKRGLLMVYRDKRDGMLEVGEISTENCKNGYPYAMLFKRTFDRVVKRKANLIGIYSDSEADEFRESVVDMDTGEIISRPKSEKKSAEKAAVQDPGFKAITEEPAPASIKVTITLDEALMHKFDGGSVWKGRMVQDLLSASDQTDAQKMKYLSMYQTRGTAADQAACKAVAEAINAGKARLQNSVEAAG